jgi:RNA polymerase sigma factor (TIGR02999 family)
MQAGSSLTGQLRLYSSGNKDVGDSLLREIFPRLRQIAVQRLSREHSSPFTPTELIGETWLTRLHRGGWRLDSREHFFGIVNRAMKNVLTDTARKRLTAFRGEGAVHLSFDEAGHGLGLAVPDVEEILAIGMLMEDLEKANPRVAFIVHLHYVVGFRLEEIAAETGLTLRQVRHLWKKGKVWLATRLHSRLK